MYYFVLFHPCWKNNKQKINKNKKIIKKKHQHRCWYQDQSFFHFTTIIVPESELKPPTHAALLNIGTWFFVPWPFNQLKRTGFVASHGSSIRQGSISNSDHTLMWLCFVAYSHRDQEERRKNQRRWWKTVSEVRDLLLTNIYNRGLISGTGVNFVCWVADTEMN